MSLLKKISGNMNLHIKVYMSIFTKKLIFLKFCKFYKNKKFRKSFNFLAVFYEILEYTFLKAYSSEEKNIPFFKSAEY